MISIIIPNYNGVENLKKNLPKVIEAMKNFDNESELIIIDDASTDDSIAEIKNQKSKIKNLSIIENGQNFGFGESCNIGVKKATGEIVILLNTDVYPEKDFLNFLISHFKDKSVFAVGCLEKTINEKGEIVEERGVGELFFKNGIYQHRAGNLNSESTDWVNGGSGAFRRNLYLKLGSFDKRFYPFYWEDVDLSFCARQAGYKVLFEKKSVVYHQHMKGSIAQKYASDEIEKISFQNQLKFTQKHASFLQKLPFFLFKIKHEIINLTP